MNRIKVVIGSLVSALTFVPALALAQQNFQLSYGISNLLVQVNKILNMIVPILIGLAVIAFLFGVLRYVFNAGQEDKRKEGRSFMIYGLIGIVVMVSVWGLVGFVQQTFGLQTGPVQSGPGIPGPRI